MTERTGKRERSRLRAGWVASVWWVAVTAQAHPGSGLAVNSKGEVFFTYGPSIIKVDTTGTAIVLAQDLSKEKFYQLHHLVLGANGNLYTASDSGTGIWEVTPQGLLKRHYPPPNRDPALLVGIGGDPFTMDSRGNLYSVNLVHRSTAQVMRVAPSGISTVLAGGRWGFADGKGEAARFAQLHGSSMTVGSDGALYLTDDGRRIRKIASDGTVSTLTGADEATDDAQKPAAARFEALTGITLDANGRVYFADAGGKRHGSGRIYSVVSGGSVKLVAGRGSRGPIEGAALEVSFDEPTGLAFGPLGELFILEPTIPRIRKLGADGRIVTILDKLPRRRP